MAAEMPCPNCGTSNPVSRTYCVKCAHELRRPAESSRGRWDVLPELRSYGTHSAETFCSNCGNEPRAGRASRARWDRLMQYAHGILPLGRSARPAALTCVDRRRDGSRTRSSSWASGGHRPVGRRRPGRRRGPHRRRRGASARSPSRPERRASSSGGSATRRRSDRRARVKRRSATRSHRWKLYGARPSWRTSCGPSSVASPRNRANRRRPSSSPIPPATAPTRLTSSSRPSARRASPTRRY